MAKPKRIATLFPVSSLIVLSVDVQIWDNFGKINEHIYVNSLVAYSLFFG